MNLTQATHNLKGGRQTTSPGENLARCRGARRTYEIGMMVSRTFFEGVDYTILGKMTWKRENFHRQS